MSGEPRKMSFGPWMMSAFRLLAKLKVLRGTALDMFGRSEERRRERALIDEYRATIDEILVGLSPANLGLAVEIAAIPESIRGYGHVKMRHLKQAEAREIELLARWRSGDIEPQTRLAAE